MRVGIIIIIVISILAHPLCMQAQGRLQIHTARSVGPRSRLCSEGHFASRGTIEWMALTGLRQQMLTSFMMTSST